MRLFLDTSTAIDVTSGNLVVEERLYSFSRSDVGLSTLALTELEQGIARCLPRFRKVNREVLNRFLKNIRIVSFDKRAAQAAAPLIAKHIRKGDMPGIFDALIAGHAASLGLGVAYTDGDFKRFGLARMQCWPRVR